MNRKISVIFLILCLSLLGQAQAKADKTEINRTFAGMKKQLKILVETSLKKMKKEKPERIKKWKISEKELAEAQEAIYKINLLILNNDLNGFMDMFGDGILLASFLDESAFDLKKDLYKNMKAFNWIKEIFFSEEFLRKEKLTKADMNYYDALSSALNNIKSPKTRYVIGVGEYRNEARYYFKDQDLYYDIFSVFFFGDEWDKGVGFGIRKIDGRWRIISYH